MRECDDTCEFCNHARVPDDLDWYTYFVGGWDYECSLSENRLDDANAQDNATDRQADANESAASTR